MKKIFLIFIGVSIVVGSIIKGISENKDYLTTKEMKNIWAGQPCGQYPCKKAESICRIGCSNIGEKCLSCTSSTGIHYSCFNEGPSGSTCTPGLDEGGCGYVYKGTCLESGIWGVCVQDEITSYLCDRRDAQGTPCPF